MTHLSRETLIAWRDHPTPDARAHIVAHLAICDTCAATFADLVRTRPPDAPPQHFNPADFTARGLEMRARTKSGRGGWTWGWVALGATAVILLVVFVTQPALPPPSTTRGGATMQPLAPAGRVDQLTTFSWTAPGNTGTFRLEVVDTAGNVVYETRITGRPVFTPAADVRAKLLPGVEYRWSVSRLDARGDIIDASALTSFTVK